MRPRTALEGQLAIDCGEELLFVDYDKYTSDTKIKFVVSGDETYFEGETQELEQGDHIAIAVLANIFETVKNARTIITPNSLKYDIDNWFEDIDVVRESEYFDRPSSGDTDYNFPDLWSMIPDRIKNENDPLTKEQADEMRSDWFTTQRVLWHMKLQKDAGMWSQWNEETLKESMSLMEAWRLSNSNPYRDK